MLGPLFRAWRRTAWRTRPTQPLRKRVQARPRLETLEDRAVPSLFGSELHINTTTADDQFQVDTASQPTLNGATVHVWTHQSAFSATDIRAQRYDGMGNKNGDEIIVASSFRPESEPTVAVDLPGHFVVAWTVRTASTGRDIRAQRFSSLGTPLTGVIAVAKSIRDEYDPSVAVADNGDFVVSYTKDSLLTSRDVFARRFRSNGTLLEKIAVATSSRREHSSSAARTADGRFAIAYQLDRSVAGGGVNSDIRLRRYASSGALLSTHAIANSGLDELDPEAAMDRLGNTIVAFEFAQSPTNHDIKARKVNSGGLMGLTLDVDTALTFEFNPAVALDLTPGEDDFVVAYQRVASLLVREMSSLGTVLATHNLGINRYDPAIGINVSDVYFVGYVQRDSFLDPEQGIFGQRGVLP